MTDRVASAAGPHAGEADQARVTFVISGLVVGGAERVLTALANGWVDQGRAVSIVTLDRPELPPFFPVDSRVSLRRLGLVGVSRSLPDAVANNLRRLAGLRRAIKSTRPDVVISFIDRTNVLTLIATAGARWPVIVSDRTASDPTTSRIWKGLRRISYRRAYRIVVQTVGSAEVMPGSLRSRTTSIPNPVLTTTVSTGHMAEPASERPPVDPDPLLVVALGRLVPQKGFDILIRAFGMVVRQAPEARLEVWGGGPEAAALQALVSQEGLEAHVRLPGETHDPQSAIGRAGVFVLSSRVEGFPNVLIEAMALGRPVIATDCTFGPAEIVRDGIDGQLVPVDDVGALADAIVELVHAPERAAELAAKAVEVRERFAFDRILGRWSALVDGAGNETAL